jgi:hypothetical protein
MFYSSFHESSNGASGWSLVLSLPQSPTQPLLSLLLPCVSLDIDNKIIIAVMRLVGLHSEVLVMSLHSMHIYIYIYIYMYFQKRNMPLCYKKCFYPMFLANDVTSVCLVFYSLQQTNKEVNCDFENTPVLSII